MNVVRNMTISAALLGLFAVVGTGLVALTYDQTHERIAANEREALLRSLHALVPPESHDNNLADDTIELTSPFHFGTDAPITVYRARRDHHPVAAVFSTIAPDGYSGNIKLLVAVRQDATLAGVRVVAHRETPGLGDRIDERRSDWIHVFDDRSLNNPASKDWKVKRDGGIFDQLTGATITPRAIVQAVHRTLLYYREHDEEIFVDTTSKEPPRT